MTKRFAMNMRATISLCAILTVAVGLSGCFSAESLRKDADEKISTCLQVGMPIDAAGRCTQKAGLSFTEWPAEPGVRVYRNTAMSAGPFAVAIVEVELRFNQSGALQSWSSRDFYDGI